MRISKEEMLSQLETENKNDIISSINEVSRKREILDEMIDEINKEPELDYGGVGYHDTGFKYLISLGLIRIPVTTEEQTALAIIREKKQGGSLDD